MLAMIAKLDVILTLSLTEILRNSNSKFQNVFKLWTSITSEPQVQSLLTSVSLECLLNIVFKKI